MHAWCHNHCVFTSIQSLHQPCEVLSNAHYFADDDEMVYAVDGLAKMELYSRIFMDRVEHLFEMCIRRNISMVVVISEVEVQQKSHRVVYELLGRSDCKLFEVKKIAVAQYNYFAVKKALTTRLSTRSHDKLFVHMHAVHVCRIQWNLHKTDTIGDQPFGRYREVVFLGRFRLPAMYFL